MCGDEFLIPPFPLPQRMPGAGYNGGNYYVGESELVGSVGLVSFQDSSHVQAKDSRMGDGQTARALRGGEGGVVNPSWLPRGPPYPDFLGGGGTKQILGALASDMYTIWKGGYMARKWIISLQECLVGNPWRLRLRQNLHLIGLGYKPTPEEKTREGTLLRLNLAFERLHMDLGITRAL